MNRTSCKANHTTSPPHYMCGALRPAANKAVSGCTDNRLLGLVSGAERQWLEPRLECLRLLPGRSLHEPGEPIRHAYFPVSGMVSLLYVSERGATLELTGVGRDGMIGLAPLLGAPADTKRALVRAAGIAYRLRLADAAAAFASGGQFRAQVLKYAQLLIAQTSQAAVCNLHHVVHQQLCRWLLANLDRLEGNEIDATHELIAGMLGVRRQGVSEAVRKLQKRNAITCSRGRITVLDRAALERDACECYRLLVRQAAWLFA